MLTAGRGPTSVDTQAPISAIVPQATAEANLPLTCRPITWASPAMRAMKTSSGSSRTAFSAWLRNRICTSGALGMRTMATATQTITA
jgi:hypothetical protein